MYQLVDILAAGVTDENGAPLSAGTVTAYDVDTANLRTIYSDWEHTAALDNPATLDAAGRLIAYTDKRLKLIIRDSSGNIIHSIDGAGFSETDVLAAALSTSLLGDGLGLDSSAIKVNTDDVTVTKATDQVMLANYGARANYAGLATTAVTANYTALTTDDVILCDATSGAITVTLPAVASTQYKVLTIKKTDSSANVVTVDGAASETIDAALTRRLLKQHGYITIAASASAWYVLQEGGLNYAVSSSATGTITGTVETAVTNLSVSFTASGTRPVVAMLIPNAASANIYTQGQGGASHSVVSGTVFVKRGATNIGKFQIQHRTPATTEDTGVYMPAALESEPEVPAAGAYTYTIAASAGNAAGSISVTGRLMVKEVLW